MSKTRNPVMVVAGTRPEVIKLSPVIEWLDKLGIDYIFVWSGQHYDYELSKIFFEQLGLPQPDIDLEVGSGSHAEQTARILVNLERVIEKFKPSIVVAQGDTNTVVASALAAAKKMVPFSHVEAGLRSWDRTMPEEINRIIADAIAELHFAPTKLAAINLMHEGIPIKKIHITGNTIVDVVYKYKDYVARKSEELLSELALKNDDYILVTVHRQENTDDPQRLRNIIKALIELSKQYTIVFPIHPRTLIKLKGYNLWDRLLAHKNILLLKPFGYFQFLGLLMRALVVLTDSGGVQEEACILKIPTLTLRYNTERPETVIIGINKVIGVETEKIIKETLKTIRHRTYIVKKVESTVNPFGDGRAGERIAKILYTAINEGIQVETIDSRDNQYISYMLIESSDIENLSKDVYHNIIALYDNNGIPITDRSKAHKLLIRVSVYRLLKIKDQKPP